MTDASKIEEFKAKLEPLIGLRVKMKATNGWFSAVLIGITDEGPLFDTDSFQEEQSPMSTPGIVG